MMYLVNKYLINVDVEEIGEFIGHIHGIWLPPDSPFMNLGLAHSMATAVSTVLVVISNTQILQDPIYNLPELVSMVGETKISLERNGKQSIEVKMDSNYWMAWAAEDEGLLLKMVQNGALDNDNRQLVCLARALLHKRSILALDAATSINTKTDNVMQKMIKEETSQCKVVEYDSPARLQSDGSSAFSKLVNEFLSRSVA
ncbi:putative ABC transporter C family member 15 [Tanacetum coccineum]